MPDNNRKVLSDFEIEKLEAAYFFTFDAEANMIYTNLTSCKKITAHDADKSFHINARKLKHKIVFSLDAIKLWIDFQQTEKFKKYSLFKVNNTVNMLKSMYQPITRENVVELLKNDFRGIKRI